MECRFYFRKWGDRLGCSIVYAPNCPVEFERKVAKPRLGQFKLMDENIDCEMEIHDLSSGLHCPFSVPSHTHHNHLPRGAETARHNSLSFFFIHPYGTLLSLLDIGAERWRALSQDCVPVTAT